MWEWRTFSNSPKILEPFSDVKVDVGPEDSPMEMPCKDVLPEADLDDRLEANPDDRIDAYVDLGLDGIGLKIRNYPKEKRDNQKEKKEKCPKLELKIRTCVIGGVEQWTKVLSEKFLVSSDNLELIAGIVYPELRKLKVDSVDLPAFERFCKEQDDSFVKVKKFRGQDTGPTGVTSEVAKVQLGENDPIYTVLIEGDSLEDLIEVGRERGVFQGDGKSPSYVGAGVVAGYPAAIRIFAEDH